MESKDKKALYTKLVAVGAAIQSIEKTGHNSHFNFKFVEASHAYNQIRSELYNRGVFMTVSLSNVEQAGTLTHVDMVITFVDSESNQKQSIQWAGYGTDKQDKGLAKAITAGVKSFLLTTLLIPSGVEPDADSGNTELSASVGAAAPVESLPTERLLEIVALAKDRGVPDEKVRTKINALGAKRASDMTEAQAKQLETWIKRQKAVVAEDV